MSDYTETQNYLELAQTSSDQWFKDRALKRAAEEITALRKANQDCVSWEKACKADLDRALARVAELTAIESLFIAATKKAEANGYGQDSEHQDDSWIDELGATMDYAQRLRQQADQMEADMGEVRRG